MSPKISKTTERLYEQALVSQNGRLHEYGPPLRRLIGHLRSHPDQIVCLEDIVLDNFGPAGTIYQYEFIAQLVHEFRFERLEKRCIQATSTAATTGREKRFQRYCRYMLKAYDDEWEDSSMLWQDQENPDGESGLGEPDGE